MKSPRGRVFATKADETSAAPPIVLGPISGRVNATEPPRTPFLTFTGIVVLFAEGVVTTLGLLCVNPSAAKLEIESLISEYRIRRAEVLKRKSPEA
jgi:hypothetical protein